MEPPRHGYAAIQASQVRGESNEVHTGNRSIDRDADSNSGGCRGAYTTDLGFHRIVASLSDSSTTTLVYDPSDGHTSLWTNGSGPLTTMELKSKSSALIIEHATDEFNGVFDVLNSDKIFKFGPAGFEGDDEIFEIGHVLPIGHSAEFLAADLELHGSCGSGPNLHVVPEPTATIPMFAAAFLLLYRHSARPLAFRAAHAHTTSCT